MTASAYGLSIGSHALENPALLAPMAGITDRPFRRIAERFGAGLVVSEMIASASLSTGQDLMVRKLAKSSGRLPHVVQLAGCEAHWMQQGARLAAEAGADAIDINLGCPAKRVTNGYAGSALMRVPDQALALIEAVLSATNLPVSVKMRLGWDDESLNAADIAKRAVAAGVHMITVHGRTRQQFYKSTARWSLVRPVVEAVQVPVVVNGDIVDLASARKALEQSGAAAVMIGRGAQGRPWVVGQIGAALAGAAPPRSPDVNTLADLVNEHYDEMLCEYGRDIGIRAARKHLGWYLDEATPDLPKVERKAVLESEDPAEVMSRMRSILTNSMRAAA
ncbi:tRNA dihydrouridine synthase DusB [Devosia pacifica]|uniref:tRNA dihydrouridine synthase DusB n=1 Tax=Devosia pacifica TaxID=1335967 RepID=UPI0024585C2E|nr:tRNA dihydrouridine synthase DusB [Devosia pacifica]